MSRGFDRLARAYRWMEYLSFGRALERCRFRFLTDLTDARSALLLGDGDGRFAARLLQSAPLVRMHAVDGSPKMLAALHARCTAGGGMDRVSTYVADLTAPLPVALQRESYDLVVTHFFLDCLQASEIERLLRQLRPLLCPGARWILSEFHVPRNAMRQPARLIVRTLYLAFGVLTGLRVRRLPNYRQSLQAHGFRQEKCIYSAGGLLVAEAWTVQPGGCKEQQSLEWEAR